jgi:hypothetical protein
LSVWPLVRIPGNDEPRSRLCSPRRLSSRRSRVQPKLPVWVAEGPRCQPWRMARDRSMYAYSFCARRWHFDVSLDFLPSASPGLLPACSTTRITPTLSMNGRLGNCKNELLRKQRSRLIGTRGLQRPISLPLLPPGMYARASLISTLLTSLLFILQLKPREATDRVLGLGGRPRGTVHPGATPLPPQRRDLGSC